MSHRTIRSVEIPDEEQGVLASFLKLSDLALEGLEQALRRATPTLDTEALISQLRAEPTLTDVPDLTDVVGTLINIAGTSYSAGTSVDETLDVIIKSINDDDIVKLTDVDAEILKVRLARLVKSTPVDIVAKASELLRANDRTFQSVRIATDLRPIYSGDNLTVAGGVIIHQLAIRATRNGQRETTYYALDSIDLQALNAVISRAMKKDKALREYASAATTPILSPSE